MYRVLAVFITGSLVSNLPAMFRIALSSKHGLYQPLCIASYLVLLGLIVWLWSRATRPHAGVSGIYMTFAMLMISLLLATTVVLLRIGTPKSTLDPILGAAIYLILVVTTLWLWRRARRKLARGD